MTQEKNIGFANTPRETEFKVGMCVHSAGCDESCWLDIIAVNKNGDAVYLDYLDGVDKISQKAINNFVLHMDSIWIGRKYREKTTSEGHVVDIVYSSSDHIAFREIRNYFSACFTRDSFLQCYEPVPIPKPSEQMKTCADDYIFSGDNSVDLWNLLDRADTVCKLREALYSVCCKLQKLEGKIAQEGERA